MPPCKLCKRCGIIQPAKEFLLNPLLKSGLDSRCRACRSELHKLWRAKPGSKEKAAAYQRQRRLRPGMKERDYQTQRKWMYGVNHEDQIKLLASQKGLCGCCGADITGKDPKGRSLACLDHCHISGKVRAFLCASCNLALGCVQDSAERLQLLISYLKRNV